MRNYGRNTEEKNATKQSETDATFCIVLKENNQTYVSGEIINFNLAVKIRILN